MEGEFREKIEELLVCTICFDCLLQPRSLSCGHIFCHNCLLQYAEKSSWLVKCPTCRREQFHIYAEECLAELDAPLYIKQALDVIQRYRGGGRRSRSLTDEREVEDLFENCFIGDQNGCWQDAFVTKDTQETSRGHENPLYCNDDHQNMKQYVCLDYDNPKDSKDDKHRDPDVADLSEQYVVTLPSEANSRYTTVESNTYRRTGNEDDEEFILTQELTFDKVWGKFVKRVKKNKKAIYKKNTTSKRSVSCDETSTEEFQEKENLSKNDLDVDNSGEDAAKYSKYAPRREIDSFKVSSSNGCRNTSKSSSNEPPSNSTKHRQLPKHLVSTSTMLASGGSAAYRHKYAPGSISKRPVYGMMGHGLPLNGQFGARPRRRSQATPTPTHSDGCSESNDFQGAFGKTPGFMPPYCQARPKVVFALKF